MPSYFTLIEQGLTRYILTFAVTIAGFSELGGSSILFRYLPVYKKNNAKDLIWIVFGLSLIGFVIINGILIVFDDFFQKYYFNSSPEIKEHKTLLYYLTFFTLIGSLASSYCVANVKTVFPKAVNDLIPKLGNTILIILFANGFLNFNQYFFWFCTLTTITAAILIIYIHSFNGWNINFSISPLSRKIYKNMIRYGGIAILGSSFLIVINYIDILMLAGLSGLEDVTKFSIGFYIINIMSVPFAAIIAVVTPLLAHAIRDKKWDEVLKHYRQTSLNNFIIGAFIFILLLIVFPEMLKLMPQEQGYESAMWIVVFLGIGRLFDMVTGCNSEIIILSRLYVFNLYTIIIISIIKVLLNIYLYQLYGMKGIAISGLVVLFLFNASRYIFIKNKLGIQPFTINTGKAFVLSCILGIVGWYFIGQIDLSISQHMYVSAFIQISIKSLLWSLVFISAILYFRISPELNNFYEMIVSRARGLFKN